jgi:hypothetical protein
MSSSCLPGDVSVTFQGTTTVCQNIDSPRFTYAMPAERPLLILQGYRSYTSEQQKLQEEIQSKDTAIIVLAVFLAIFAALFAVFLTFYLLYPQRRA